MTGRADNDAQGGSEDRHWRAQTLKGAREGPSDSAHAHGVVFLVRDFRLPEVLEHIEAGQIVIIVPAPQAPE